MASTPTSNSLESLVLELLPSRIRELSFQQGLRDHNNFVGQKALKNAVISALPIQGLINVGISENRIRAMVKCQLKDGLTQEIIEETKRRKEGQSSLGGGQFSPHVSEVGGNPVLAQIRTQDPVYSEDDASELSLTIPQNFLAARLDDLSFDNQSPYSPHCISASDSTTNSTPVDISLQYYIFRVLQDNYETACHAFAMRNLQCIFWKKSEWKSSPHALELNKWGKEIINNIKHAYNIPGWNDALNSNTPTETRALTRDLNTILLNISGLRHDAVHRKVVDVERILGYVRLGSMMVENFLAWGGGPGGTTQDQSSGVMQATGLQQQPQETLVQIQENLKILEANLETVIREFARENEDSMSDELPPWESSLGTGHGARYKKVVSRDFKGIDELLKTLARMNENWSPESPSASISASEPEPESTSASLSSVSPAGNRSSSRSPFMDFSLHDQTPRFQSSIDLRFIDAMPPHPPHQPAQSFRWGYPPS